MKRRLLLGALAAVLLLILITRHPESRAVPPIGPSLAPATAQIALSRDTLVFDSDRTGNYELFAMRLDGSRVWQLTSDGRYDSWWARISRDRTRILFYRTPKGTHDRDFTKTNLWVMNADGSGQRELRRAHTDGWLIQGHAEWSPDGRSIVMTGTDFLSAQVFITDADGQHPREVTHLKAGGNDPSWSPDGSTIVFFSCPGQACPSREQEIYTIPAMGGTARRLTFNTIEDNDPYYSPDGTMIAWLAQTDLKPEPGGVWNDFVMKADGSDQRNLTNDSMINSKPQWSNDGSRIFFHRFERGRRTTWSIFSIRLDGSGLTEVTKGQPGNNEYPSN